jgi:hypothetical protein
MEQEIAYLCSIRYPQQCLDTPDRTFVMSTIAVRVRSSLSRISVDKPNTRNEEALGDLPGASLHHRYITEVGVTSSSTR